MTFRHYTICQDSQGATLEVWRGTDEVACLAFDNQQLCFVELHVAITPPERSLDSASFQALVQLAAPLRHRHLLSILEGGEDEGSNYHITPFLDGERLDTWLARCSPLPPWLALHIILQLVEGLASLTSHPRLLAGVEVFHAGLTLVGPHSDELTVRICDLGLSGTRLTSTEPQFIEARAIHETGRLLLYMLTGVLTDYPVTPQTLAAQSLSPELSFLLLTLFQSTQPHHPRTLEQLRTLTQRCLHDLPPDLASRPILLPTAYRPRLPLANQFPDGSTIADHLSHDYTIDPRSTDPYRQRGIQRATRRAVTVQHFPPANLLPPEHLLPQLEKAWTTLAATPHPSLLTPLTYDPEAPVPLLIEALPGKFTLDSLRRLRAPLDPVEVHFLLLKLDQSITAAETLDLLPHWRCPGLIPVQFTDPKGDESLPSPAQLARLSLTDWPPFTLALRCWPLTLDFTQPERSQLEYLLPRDPALAGTSLPLASPSPTAPPSVRDFALLVLWLLGGSSHLKENLKPLLHAAISARGPALASRQEFLTRLYTLATARPTEPVSFPKPKIKTKPGLKTSRIPSPSLHSYQNLEAESAFELPAISFAEALFGTPQNQNTPEQVASYDPSPLWPVPSAQNLPESLSGASDYPFDAPPEGIPLGFMEAANSSTAWDPNAASSSYHNQQASSQKTTNRWMLLLIVLLIAAALAALMAQLSGQAIWLK